MRAGSDMPSTPGTDRRLRGARDGRHATGERPDERKDGRGRPMRPRPSPTIRAPRLGARSRLSAPNPPCACA